LDIAALAPTSSWCLGHGGRLLTDLAGVIKENFDKA
jgi:hypothetical protein